MSDDESIDEPKEEPKEETEDETEDVEMIECASSDTIEKKIDGKIYMMEKGDEDKCLYDKVTRECVGTYDEEKDALKPLEELDSDSDDE